MTTCHISSQSMILVHILSDFCQMQILHRNTLWVFQKLHHDARMIKTLDFEWSGGLQS